MWIIHAYTWHTCIYTLVPHSYGERSRCEAYSDLTWGAVSLVSPSDTQLPGPAQDTPGEYGIGWVHHHKYMHSTDNQRLQENSENIHMHVMPLLHAESPSTYDSWLDHSMVKRYRCTCITQMDTQCIWTCTDIVCFNFLQFRHDNGYTCEEQGQIHVYSWLSTYMLVHTEWYWELWRLAVTRWP